MLLKKEDREERDAIVAMLKVAKRRIIELMKKIGKPLPNHLNHNTLDTLMTDLCNLDDSCNDNDIPATRPRAMKRASRKSP